jgi:hypothetical protein
MKLRIYIALLLFTFGNSFAQTQEWGEKFDFDTKNELEPKFVLTDNYNNYLLTVVNKFGMVASNQIILRKFDQKNNLIETITHPFPVLEGGGTLHNFLGSFAIGSEKAVVFTQSYSGKSKRDEVYQHVFDKSNKKFTSTMLMGFAIVSNSKSGDVTVKQSQNGQYFVVNYKAANSKKEPEVNHLMVLNCNTLDVAWKREVTFTNEFFTRHLVATNSGKAILVRLPYGYKLDNYLVAVSETEQTDLKVGESIKIHQPVAISIGTQDYLLAMNYPSKGIRRGDFGDLMLYDLNSGTILKNNEVSGFNSVTKIEEVNFRYILMQNNEIAIFAEAKVDATPAPVPGSTGFPVSKYTFGPSFLITLNFEGALKSMKPIPSSSTNEANLFHSFGLVNAKGQLYVNTGSDNSFYKWNYIFNNEKLAYSIAFSMYDNSNNRVQYINQLVHYYPDTQKFLFARITTNDRTQMSLGTFSGVN